MTRTKIIVWSVCAGVALVGLVILFCFDPTRSTIYPTCTFHQLTGLNCPGCGSLRALHQLSHGNVVAAFHFNPLLVISLPLMIWVGVRWAWSSVPPFTGQPRAWWWFAGVIVAFGVARNLPFPAFAWMSP